MARVVPNVGFPMTASSTGSRLVHGTNNRSEYWLELIGPVVTSTGSTDRGSSTARWCSTPSDDWFGGVITARSTGLDDRFGGVQINGSMTGPSTGLAVFSTLDDWLEHRLVVPNTASMIGWRYQHRPEHWLDDHARWCSTPARRPASSTRLVCLAPARCRLVYPVVFNTGSMTGSVFAHRHWPR